MGATVTPFGSSGFYTFYGIDSVDEQSQSIDIEERSDTPAKGLNSLWGIIRHIVELTGWTWHEVMYGTSWVNLRMMLADTPSVKSELKQATAEDFLKL